MAEIDDYIYSSVMELLGVDLRMNCGWICTVKSLKWLSLPLSFVSLLLWLVTASRSPFFYLVSVFQLSSHTYTPLTFLKGIFCTCLKRKNILMKLEYCLTCIWTCCLWRRCYCYKLSLSDLTLHTCQEKIIYYKTYNSGSEFLSID